MRAVKLFVALAAMVGISTATAGVAVYFSDNAEKMER